MIETLALNRASIPIEIISWKRAISLWFTNKACILHDYDDKKVSSPSLTMNVPAVIQYLDDDFQMSRFINTVPLTRRNLFDRDDGKCMYCGKKISMNSFTFDHVVPRKLGGKISWTNIVASCVKCNSKKGSQMLKNSGMSLIREPFIPKLTKSAPAAVACELGLFPSHRIRHESWNNYIYWEIVKV